MKMENAMLEIFGDVVSAYTRSAAIADGFLVDVTETAKEAGFKCPVALTREVWEAFVAWSDEDSKKQTYQDESGRLWDVLFMAYVNIKRVKEPCTELPYTIFCVPKDGKTRKSVVSHLKLHVGPGDDGELVITVMLPNQD